MRHSANFTPAIIFWGSISFGLMVVAVDRIIHNSEEGKVFISEMFRPEKSKETKHGVPSLLVGILFTFLLSAIGFGVYGYYTAAAWCFGGSWLSTTTTAFVALARFSRRARITWTCLIAVVSGLIFFCLFLSVCPTLTISPSETKFSMVGQLYSFRVENKSDHDTYMNSFLFYLDSSVYSAKDFDFQVTQDSLKPLAQQLNNIDYGVPDSFGSFGFVPDYPDRHFFWFYVYHLAPHESREVTIKLNHYEMSTNQTVDMSSEVMSYINKAIPISRYGTVVYTTALVNRPLAISGFLICDLKQGVHIPCEMRPLTQGGSVNVPQTCVSLAVISEREEIPKKVLPGNCDP